MEGKTYITILGLLLFEALASLYMGMRTNQTSVELVFTIIFVVAAIAVIAAGSKRDRAALPAGVGFPLGFFNVLYLTQYELSLWLVIMLCLNAAGFILALDALAERARLPVKRPMPVRLHPRKDELAKELPKQEKPRVIVYHEEHAAPPKPPAKKRGRPAKNATKKTAKKTTTKRITKQA